MSLVKYNNNSISAVTSAASIPSGALVPIKTLTASSSSTLSFVHGSSDVVLDSTYPIYKFVCINCHPSQQGGDGDEFQVNFRDGSTAYDATKTSTFFSAVHGEDGSGAGVAYRTSHDLAQSTNFQNLAVDMDADNDTQVSGELFLYSPSSTTFVKHFIWKGNHVHSSASMQNTFVAGYCNTTTAIDGVQFKMSAGNIASGKIKLYGIKDS